jgi:hypothetical protein
MKIIELALELNVSIRGEDHPLTMDSLYFKAWNLNCNIIFMESAEIVEKVVKFRENRFGKDNIETLLAYNL